MLGSTRFDDRKFQWREKSMGVLWFFISFHFISFFFFSTVSSFSFLSSSEEKRKEKGEEGGRKNWTRNEKTNVRFHFLFSFSLKFYDRRKSPTLEVFVIGAISSRRSCLLLVEKKNANLEILSFIPLLSPFFSLSRGGSSLFLSIPLSSIFFFFP